MRYLPAAVALSAFAIPTTALAQLIGDSTQQSQPQPGGKTNAEGGPQDPPQPGEGTPSGFRPKLDGSVPLRYNYGMEPVPPGRKTVIVQKNAAIQAHIRNEFDLYFSLRDRYNCKRPEMLDVLNEIDGDITKMRANIRDRSSNLPRDRGFVSAGDAAAADDWAFKLATLRSSYEHLLSCSDPEASRGQESIGHWYGALAVGAAFAQGSSPAAIGGTGLDHEPGYNIGGIVGYDFGKFRLEAEIDYKRFRTTQYRLALPIAIPGLPDFPDRPGTPGTFLAPAQTPIATGHSSVVSFMANGLYDIVDTKGLTISVGGGIGLAKVNLDLESYRLPRTTDSSSDTKFAWQVLAGIGVPISDKVDVGMRFEYSRSARETLGAFEVSSSGSLIATIEIDLDDLDTPKSESDHFPVAPVEPLPPEEGQPTAPVM